MTDLERAQKRDALRRYEDARRNQLGAASNLTFALAAGGVGFCGSLLAAKEPAWSCPGNYIFLVSIALFIVTIGLSMFLAWTRLKDFRLTACKLRLELRNADREQIEKLSSQTDQLGNRTWCLYRWQTIVFGIAVLCLIVSLSLTFRHRIFP
jgi:hypothetical protein